MPDIQCPQSARRAVLRSLDLSRKGGQGHAAAVLSGRNSMEAFCALRDQSPETQMYLSAEGGVSHLDTCMDSPVMVAAADRYGSASLVRAGLGCEPVPLNLVDYDPSMPDSLRGFLARDSQVPLLIEISARVPGRHKTYPLIVPFAAPGSRAKAWHAAHVSHPVVGGAWGGHRGAHRNCVFHLRNDAFGPSAHLAILLGMDRMLGAFARDGRACPVLLRIDFAGLGLSRAEYRNLETQLSHLLKCYGSATGKSGILLGELGFVREYADSTAVLDPGGACRVDLRLPSHRHHPTMVNLHQCPVGGQAGGTPLDITLTNPEGSRVDISTGDLSEAAVMYDNCGGAVASIATASRPRQGYGRSTHVMGLGPTCGEGSYAGCRSMAGEWEITVSNGGPEPVALTFVLDDAMPLLPRWQLPRATIRFSRSHDWDPEVLGFVRPAFFDLRSRFDALVRQADPVPDLAIRRHAEPTVWPMVSVCYGIQMTRMTFDQSGRGAGPLAIHDRQPGQEGPLRDTLMRQSEDALIDTCLDAMIMTRPETVDQVIRDSLAFSAE